MGKSYKASRHAKKRPTRRSRKSRKSRHTKKRRTSRHTKKRRQRRGGWPSWGAKPAPKALVATPPVVRAPVCSRKSYLFDNKKYRTYGNYEGDRIMKNDKCVAEGQGKWVSTNGKMTLDGNWENDEFKIPEPPRGPSSTHFDKAMTKAGYTDEGKTRLREFGSR